MTEISDAAPAGPPISFSVGKSNPSLNPPTKLLARMSPQKQTAAPDHCGQPHKTEFNGVSCCYDYHGSIFGRGQPEIFCSPTLKYSTNNGKVLHDELKAKGNHYFTENKYDEAVDCYTEAVKLLPFSHVAFSNRSAAYIKLGDYQKGLADAIQCVSLSPKFARGYLRKATALNLLEKYKEALPEAEKGYKLRGSDRVCKDCISQWLVATTAQLKPDIEKLEDIPPGIFPVSKTCVNILSNIQLQHASPGGLSVQSLKMHVSEIIRELGCVLNQFGHNLGQCVHEWVIVFEQILVADPRSHSAPLTAVESLALRSKEFTSWLEMDVDPALYPVIQPVIGLLTLSILTCVSTISRMISNRELIQILTKTCLHFYQESILSDEQFIRLHIHALQLLLNSFCMESGRHARRRGEQERMEIKTFSKKLECLLEQYPLSSTDYATVERTTREILEMAAILCSQSCNDPPKSSSKALTKGDIMMIKNEVAKEKKRLLDMKSSGESRLHFRDMDSLVLTTGPLIHLGEIEAAKLVLAFCESLYFYVITELLENNLLSLDTAAENFFHSQMMMFSNGLYLASTSNTMVADIFIRWKCLSTELYALLCRFGIGKSIMNVFTTIEQLKVDGQGMACDGTLLANLADNHQKEAGKILHEWGPKVVSALSTQSCELIQKQLKPDQILLQFCMTPLYDTECYPVPIPPKTLGVSGVLIAIRAKDSPIVKVIDFKMIQDVSIECHNTGMKAVAAKRAGKPWQHLQDVADQKAGALLELVLPTEVQMLVSGTCIKRILFCPDQLLAKFPLEILLFQDGERLGQKCAITYMSSAREILRDSTYASLHSEIVKHLETTSNDCIIFANPNFDLEKPETAEWSIWSQLNSTLNSFFSKPTPSTALPLPGSESEANDIEYLLSSAHSGKLHIQLSAGDDATLLSAMQTQSPHILHFATHGFSNPDFHYQYHNFWSDTRSGLLLAGANTYRLGKFGAICDAAGTGELTALAACGMALTGTRLVYLSTCQSSYGFVGRGEALSSLAQGFRIAGAKTVVATLWPVSDEASRKLALHFYFFACNAGMHPSLALQEAKKKMREEGYEHWYDWAGYICIGCDLPLFS